MATRVIIMAGGTGGHVFPALAVARELRARGCEVRWLGTPDSFESRLVPQHGIPMDLVEIPRLRGRRGAAMLAAPWRLAGALLRVWRLLRRRRPQVLLGMGGFVSGPGGLAGRLLGVPLVIHEQNTLPGLTNRWLARIASRVLEAFPGSFDTRVGARVCGNPVRREIVELPPPEERIDPRATGPLRVLVMGGSLGAVALNEVLPRALALLDPDERPRLCHQTGRGKLEAARAAYRAAGVEATLIEFVADVPRALAEAELVICRAGALTVSELACAGVASVLVPWPLAVDDHQTRNARYLSEAGAAVLLPERELEPRRLAGLLRELADRRRLLDMARRARERAMPEAVRCVADHCMEVAA